jgi:hypothetical protein
MTEMVTSGSMSGERKRSDGLLGESDYERRRLLQAPPVLPATALLLDSTRPTRVIARSASLGQVSSRRAGGAGPGGRKAVSSR